MNIGIVTTWFERGAAYVSKAYREALVSRHNVYVFARGGDGDGRGNPNWDAEYVTWGPYVPDGGRTGVAWRLFRRWVRARRLDMILFNEQHSWTPVVRARRKLRVPIGAYVDYYTRRTAPFFHLYDFLLCNTKRHHSVFQNHPNAIHIPWGTDCRKLRASCEPVRPGEVVFFHSAGMSPGRKGTALVLEAFRKLTGPCRLLLHLQAPLSKHPEVEGLCGEDSRIEVVNETVPFPGLYHRGDVYVYPTRLEGIGLTVPEALASGLPVIATKAPPMTEFVRDGETGILVEPVEQRTREDGYYWPEDLCSAEGVRKAMAFYVDNVSRVGGFKRAARAHAERNLDWTKNAENLPGLLEALADAHLGRTDQRPLERRAERYSRGLLLRQILRRLPFAGREST